MFTPTHLGPSLFFFAIKPKIFNFWALLLGSIMMDFENAGLIILNFASNCPNCTHHGFFHSILGAIIGSFVLAFLISKFKNPLNKISLKLKFNQPFAFPILFFSGFFGWTLHVLADSLVHSDVFLFWPIKTTPFLISWTLYWPLSFIFTVLGAFSLIILVAKIVKSKR